MLRNSVRHFFGLEDQMERCALSIHYSIHQDNPQPSLFITTPRIAKIHKSYSLPPTHPQIDSRIFLDHSHFQIAQDHRYHPLADAYGHTAYSIPQIDQKLFQLINETGPTPTQLLFVHSFILKY